MFNVNFNGTVNIPLPWNSSTITAAGGSPPPANFTDQQSTATVSPDSSVINWIGNVPSTLQGLSVNQILLSPLLPGAQIQRTIVATVTSGQQQSEDFGKPLLHLYFLYASGTVDSGFDIESLEWVASPCLAGFGPSEEGYHYPFNNQSPTGTLTLPLITPNEAAASIERLTQIEVSPWNECNQCPTVNFDCENRDVDDFTMTMVMNVTVSFSCIGSNLESGFCLTFCSETANQQFCQPNYVDFCLNQLDPAANEINIFTSNGCQMFFEDYIANNGPKSEIDTPLTVACSLKFPGFESFFQSNDLNVQKVCACHLNDQLYTNLKNSIVAQFPGFAFVAENDHCLFPPCASTVFTTTSIGRRCALPGCINIANITNNGNITGGTKINQNDQCINAANQSGSGGGGGGNGGGNITSLSWWEQHWVWIVLGIGLLIVLIIVILIIIAAESNKPKPHFVMREL